MGMKSSSFGFSTFLNRVIPYMGMKLYRLLKIPIIVQSYPLYGNEITTCPISCDKVYELFLIWE